MVLERVCFELFSDEKVFKPFSSLNIDYLTYTVLAAGPSLLNASIKDTRKPTSSLSKS